MSFNHLYFIYSSQSSQSHSSPNWRAFLQRPTVTTPPLFWHLAGLKAIRASLAHSHAGQQFLRSAVVLDSCHLDLLYVTTCRTTFIHRPRRSIALPPPGWLGGSDSDRWWPNHKNETTGEELKKKLIFCLNASLVRGCRGAVHLAFFAHACPPSSCCAYAQHLEGCSTML